MPGLFADLRKQLRSAQIEDERELVTDRIYEELDKLRDLVSGVVAAPNLPGRGPIATGFVPQSPGATGGSSGTGTTTTEADADTFELPAAPGEVITADQTVSMVLDTATGTVLAYLSDASNTARRADAICIGTVYRGGERRLVCIRRKRTRVRMAAGAMPTVGSDLFVSALTPGALTDNPSESPTRKFSQRVGKYITQATNSMNQLQDGVAIADVDFPPASSLPAAASA